MPELLTKTISFAEYLLLPYDRKKTEFVDGNIVDMAEASPLHVAIITFLQQLLIAHIKTQGLKLACYAGTGIAIPRTDRENNVRDPDLVVCDQEQWRAMRHLTKAIFLEGNPPALAIEVASPGDTTRDTVDKRLEYAWAKVPEYWIINPVDGYVLVLVLDVDTNTYCEVGEYRDTELISSLLFPELKVSAKALLNPD
ncbi:MAG: Uma2 family endonuclease [Cyanobacteria bacterium J06648_10]